MIKCTLLRDINITKCPFLTDISGLQNCDFLENFSLKNCPKVTNFDLFLSCTGLKIIRLINDSEEHFGPIEIKQICFQNITKLEELVISNYLLEDNFSFQFSKS